MSQQKKYDFSRFETKKRTVHGTSAPRLTSGQGGNAAARFRVRFSNIFLYFVICLTLVTILISYVKLTEVTSTITTLQSELSRVENEGRVLQTQLESKTKLDEVEEIAKNQLGMVKVQSHQLEYSTQSSEGKAEVFKRKGGIVSNVYDAVSKTFNAVLSYIS